MSILLNTPNTQIRCPACDEPLSVLGGYTRDFDDIEWDIDRFADPSFNFTVVSVHSSLPTCNAVLVLTRIGGKVSFRFAEESDVAALIPEHRMRLAQYLLGGPHPPDTSSFMIPTNSLTTT